MQPTEYNNTDPLRAGLLTVRELAALLRVSRTAVYRLVEKRAIPFYRLPQGLRFAKGEVEAFIERCRVGTLA